METIEVKHKHFSCKIGQRNENCFVNVHTNFVPLEHNDFIQAIRNSKIVEYIPNVADYGDGSGGMCIMITPMADEMDLYNELERLMKLELLY